MLRVKVSADALRDLLEIVDFISSGGPQAARKWARSIVALFALFARHPRMGEKYRWGRRYCRRFTKGKYVIYFRPEVDELVILRIVHGAQRPPKPH